MKQLKDLCSGYTKNIALKDLSNNDGQYPIYGASGFIKNIDYYVSDKPYIGIVKDGAGVGRTSVYPACSSLLGTMQYIIPNDDVDIHYLKYALQSLRLGNACSGAAIPHIYFKNYKSAQISIGDISEQKRISKILTDIECGIDNLYKQIFELDELIKSRFIEMFGIYPTNEKGWETGIIRDIVTDVHYGTSRPAVDGGKYPYIRMNNITSNGELDVRVEQSRILPEFLSAFLNTDFSKVMLANKCKKAVNQANINAQEMQSIGIYIPPLNLQQDFVGFKSKVDDAKAIVKQQLIDLQELLDSKMDEYFG